MAKKEAARFLPPNVSLEPNQQQEFDKKIKDIKATTQNTSGLSGVVYVGHIPHGFFEEQMRGFFSQFGKVNRVRIARSKKTGNIKGYAFVEFLYDEVAEIVADTMNNYLMFNKLLKCQHLPAEKVHPMTFKGSGRMFRKPKAHRVANDRHNKEKTEKEQHRAANKLTAKSKKKMAKLKAMGIDYQFEGMNVEQKKLLLSERVRQDSEGGHEDLQIEQIQVLYEDASDEEVTFKTPPHSVRTPKPKTPKSKLADTDVKPLDLKLSPAVDEEQYHSAEDNNTPVKQTPKSTKKRKNEKTPARPASSPMSKRVTRSVSKKITK